LYDLSNDIGEQKNLSDQLPEIRDSLAEILHQWQKEVDARFPSPNPNSEKR